MGQKLGTAVPLSLRGLQWVPVKATWIWIWINNRQNLRWSITKDTRTNIFGITSMSVHRCLYGMVRSCVLNAETLSAFMANWDLMVAK